MSDVCGNRGLERNAFCAKRSYSHPRTARASLRTPAVRLSIVPPAAVIHRMKMRRRLRLVGPSISCIRWCCFPRASTRGGGGGASAGTPLLPAKQQAQAQQLLVIAGHAEDCALWCCGCWACALCQETRTHKRRDHHRELPAATKGRQDGTACWDLADVAAHIAAESPLALMRGMHQALSNMPPPPPRAGENNNSTRERVGGSSGT